jgi:tRNA threonylcarbamoyladenosine biosynthesis protein TsaB
MIVLAIDTCDVHGSISILSTGEIVATVVHDVAEDYSSWLLPAVDRALRAASKPLTDVDLFAVATGPGSFTGVRIGLTTVKAWGEVFGKPIVGVSRLEVLTAESKGTAPYVASFIDAQRGQLFGALYKQNLDDLKLEGEELVTAAPDFIAGVNEQTGTETVEWISTDPEILLQSTAWQARSARGEQILKVPDVLAPLIAKLAEHKASRGQVLDALSLDANYVRRSYVEVFQKGAPHVSGK